MRHKTSRISNFSTLREIPNMLSCTLIKWYNIVYSYYKNHQFLTNKVVSVIKSILKLNDIFYFLAMPRNNSKLNGNRLYCNINTVSKKYNYLYTENQSFRRKYFKHGKLLFGIA